LLIRCLLWPALSDGAFMTTGHIIFHASLAGQHILKPVLEEPP
jgi:hypothetical protein